MTDALVNGVERLATAARWLEGPCWVPARRSVVMSDIPGNRVLEWHAETGELTVLEDRCEFTNGRTLAADGSLLECSHGRRAVQRRQFTENGSSTEVLVDRWHDHRLNSPNDLVVSRDGAIWFSDPSYGIDLPDEGHPGEREYGDRWVFRLDPTGRLSPVVTDIVAPNGLAFSPDETLLYVADSDVAAQIRVYDVVDGCRAKNGRWFATVPAGVPDGIRVDASGRVWSSAADGVHVYDTLGTHVGFVGVPEVVSNLCFGDDDWVYVTASTSLYRFRIHDLPG
ncbi:SMP-30/gluconolactonase/LRE family protein [Aestuariimicrobium kwangyangense]|uniref:SMP-30/gluconolactonase/LRE family protein n=1 Tax=Aestuariimicrobium kwangyangense TaxID=396389 RepID=UPI000478F45B|nr:SMP-30/gluconolactonase/LRE family protein [Aestuariimicrobium kwangyangense]